ncbi:MAG: hypothetical protein ACTHN8_16120 [Angustibacter sp.]
MSIRPEVAALARWAPLPPEDEWEPQRIDEFVAAIDAVSPPLTAQERRALIPVLGGPSEDSVYGVAWGVLHLLETAPDDGWQERLDTAASPWFDLLLVRWRNHVASTQE